MLIQCFRTAPKSEVKHALEELKPDRKLGSKILRMFKVGSGLNRQK